MIKNRLVLVGFVVIGWSCWSQPGLAQVSREEQTVVISAEDLGKEFAPDTLDPVTKYQGQRIRVTGRISMAHEPFVYLRTGSKFPTGQPVLISLDYTNVAFPRTGAGDVGVAEGLFDRKGIFGPTLVKCKLTPVAEKASGRAQGAGGPAPAARPATKKARVTRKDAGKGGDRGSVDPRALLLRFDGPVAEGEVGSRPGWSSFRLRLPPGNWRGTTLGISDAWGDGNNGKDHWGIGSGEKTACSRLMEDADGYFFVFSVAGTRWESNWIAAMFRYTLADGQPGVATVLFPCR